MLSQSVNVLLGGEKAHLPKFNKMFQSFNLLEVKSRRVNFEFQGKIIQDSIGCSLSFFTKRNVSVKIVLFLFVKIKKKLNKAVFQLLDVY